MRRTSPTTDRRAGFTLAEVLVTLAVLALVAAVVFPRIAASTGPARLKASAYDVAGLLRSDRTAALRTGKIVVTSVDLGNRAVRSGTSAATVAFPKDVALTVAYASREAAPAVRFFPNGSSSGARLTLKSPSTAYNVSVDWFTGAVNIDGPHAP